MFDFVRIDFYSPCNSDAYCLCSVRSSANNAYDCCVHLLKKVVGMRAFLESRLTLRLLAIEKGSFEDLRLIAPLKKIIYKYKI